jgi:hypothetical protein
VRQKIYIIVAVLWCAAFPAGQYLMKVVIDSSEGAPTQAIAIVATMLGFGIAAVLLEPKKNQKSTNPPPLRD